MTKHKVYKVQIIGMKMAKGNKLTRIVASVALPIISFLNYGCELTPAQEMAAGSVSAQHTATTNPSLTYQQSGALGAIGGLLGILAQQESAKEAAREIIPSDVRVEIISPETHPQYYNNQTQNRGGQKIPDSFICNYLYDLSKNGRIEDEEIRGINKTVFSQYEFITAGARWYNCGGSIITSQIKNERGEILDIQPVELNINEDDIYVRNFFGCPAGLSKIHKFTSEWYKNGKPAQEKTVNFFVDYNKRWEDVPVNLRILPKIFLCNRYEDINVGHVIPEEYGGLKNVFKPQEDIYALCSFENKEWERGSLNIVSLDNKEVMENYGEIFEDSDNLIRSKNWFIHYKLNANEIKKQLGGNSFRADWYSNGIKYNSLEFKILDE